MTPEHRTTTVPFEIRDATRADHPPILAINDAAVPAMNRLDAAALESLLGHAAYARVAVSAGAVTAFLIGLPQDVPYDSPNYRWFVERYRGFLYIDRIAVAAHARGLGIGTALYRDMGTAARGRYECLLAEVNEAPPNPRSIAFHERNGFTRVGELAHTYAGAHATRVGMWRRAVG